MVTTLARISCGWPIESRLEEPINRFRVTAVFHGHAHKGAPDGATSTGIPVYNVSLPVLQKQTPDQARYRIVEV